MLSLHLLFSFTSIHLEKPRGGRRVNFVCIPIRGRGLLSGLKGKRIYLR